MAHHWILDVLRDLTSFARTNGLTDLAEQLDDTMMVAARSLPSNGEGPCHEQPTSAFHARDDARSAARKL
jgi:hypothetical protein